MEEQQPQKKSKSWIWILILLILIAVGIGIYLLLSGENSISQLSPGGPLILKDISPFSFNGSQSLSQENLESIGSNVLEGNNARYLYFKLGNYGNVQESIISSATVYTFNSASATQEFLDKTKRLWDERKLSYTTQILQGKNVYTFTHGDQNQFMWAHENYLIQISIDRERGVTDMTKGLEVRDAYLKKYS